MLQCHRLRRLVALMMNTRHTHMASLLVLATSLAAGCGTDVGHPGYPLIAYSSQQSFRPERLCPDCPTYDVTQPPPADLTADTMVLIGHSAPPEHVLDRPPTEVFRRLARIQPDPELLVLDTCFGASDALIGAMLDAGLKPRTVVAYAGRVPLAGFRYADRFFNDPTIDRAARVDAISCCGDGPRALTRLEGDYARAISRTLAGHRSAARRCELDAPFHSILPNRVRHHNSADEAIQGPFLYEVLPEDWCPGQSAPFTVEEGGT